MDEQTIKYYDDVAAETARRYEEADLSSLHLLLLRYLSGKKRVLEIGCGSGRDAAFLLANGFDVLAMDASSGMLRCSHQFHKELASRLIEASFPLAPDSPILQEKFDAVVSIATIMHVPEKEFFEWATQVRDLLENGGILVLSASVGRSGIVDGRDRNGRLYVERPAAQVQLLFERLGFRLLTCAENKDAHQRDIGWYTLIMTREPRGSSLSVNEIESIITDDNKDTTYKLALLKALCDIAQAETAEIHWQPNGTVGIPLGLVVGKWLFYYWPLIAPDVEGAEHVAIPQKHGGERRLMLMFRRPMRELIRAYRPLGAFSQFAIDFKAGTVRCDTAVLRRAVDAISCAIVEGPVRFTRGGRQREGCYFSFQGNKKTRFNVTGAEEVSAKLGTLFVPAKAWREFCLIGHWVSESLILRWAELTHRMSRNEIPIKDVVDRLLVQPTFERDVSFAREVYSGKEDLECVWTGAKLKRNLAIDHAIPFSLWHNNDLWNLLPTAKDANGSKSDKLVSKRILLASKDRIVASWEMMRAASERRFVVEVSRTLFREPCPPANWQKECFSGLMNRIEMLAIHRGIQRWEP